MNKEKLEDSIKQTLARPDVHTLYKHSASRVTLRNLVYRGIPQKIPSKSGSLNCRKYLHKYCYCKHIPYGMKILHGIKFYGFTLVGTTVKLKSINFYYCIAKILSCFDNRKI